MLKAIEVNNLSYSYPDGLTALKNISMDLFDGESLGIIGPNGAGKSTFLLHLNGILTGSGDIKILGADVSEKNIKFIRSKVGLVFQDPDSQLFMPTVYEDVAFGPINMGMGKPSVKAAVESALQEVDMSTCSKRLSHHLSFGEKKRVSIATVLSMNPEILVLDEPSSNLDPKHRRHLIEFLNQLKLTKVIATHDLDLVKHCCTKVAIFDSGELKAFGSVEEIVENEQLLDEHGLR